ncbi:hypothetical protein PARHAE_02513 [Paracoccus haematequi]|uniref:2,4-dihydroxyhept-2-ene-1,7-dioic acid aldolase n=1 Tax=Paracoccus haematequi TaxID=2491866 RepID=A0A447IPA7_9RHOB|nr:hypothetical protein PARHAE_02513 [Paracoccus haematequi]
MKPNRIREIWTKGGCALNAFLSIPSPFVAEVMAAQGYDGLIVDLQHGVTDYMAAVGMFQTMWGNLANDLDGHRILLLFCCLPQHVAESAILCLGKPALADIVLRLFDAMRWVAIDDAGIEGLGKDAARKTYRACRRTGAAPHDGLPAQLLRLDRHAGLTGHDVLQDLVDVSFRQILHPPRADQRDDVAFDAACVGNDGGRFLGATAFGRGSGLH